ncbi:hypothetical protein UlMin_035601 [Ulmus minor]
MEIPETEARKESRIEVYNSEPLIPGLPNDVAELCLLHLPYPYQALVRSVSVSWNKAVTDPTFLFCKKSLSLSLPYFFVFAFNKSTDKMQWQALDPRSGRWFVLPSMPFPNSVCPSGFACASLPRHGKLFVLGGKRSDAECPMQTAMVYRTSTNQWTEAKPMPTARSYFDAGSINGKIITVGGSGTRPGESITAVELYDQDKDTWTAAAKLPLPLARYHSAVVGGKMYVTEGWTWPFMFSPRGAVYDLENDTWREMRAEMREGWTGVSAVVGDRLFVISEHGDCPMKWYDSDDDTWRYVSGEKFPCEALRRPLAVSGLDGKYIYVVASGLNVGIGKVYQGEGNKEVKVEWQVLPAPTAFQGFAPSTCQLLYA